MIAIYLTEDWTQVVRANIKKDALNLLAGDYLGRSYLQDVMRSDVGQLTEMFREVFEQLGVKDEEVYVILPDNAFRKINCYEDGVDLEVDVQEDLHIPLTECVLAAPLTVNKPTLKKKTICVLDVSCINALVQAAKDSKALLVSVEAASSIFLRATKQWDKEQMALFIFDKEASLMSYNPLGGFYVQKLGKELSLAEIQGTEEDVDSTLRAILARGDYTNNTTFRLANPDVPLYIISDDEEGYSELPALKKRYIPLPRNKGRVRGISDVEYREFLFPITVMLDKIHPAYPPTTVSFLQISSGNIIPEDVKSKSRRVMFRKSIRKWTKTTVATTAVLIGIELMSGIYFSTRGIPAELEKQYSTAQENMGSVNTELARIKQSKEEDTNGMIALNEIVSIKPDGLGFLDVEIGARGAQTQDKDKNKKWVKFSAKAKDPMLIQDYVNKISGKSMFNNVIIEEISADGFQADSTKRARVTVGKRI